MKNKLEFRGRKFGFPVGWVLRNKKLYKSPDHKLSNEPSFFKIGKVYDELQEGNWKCCTIKIKNALINPKPPISSCCNFLSKWNYDMRSSTSFFDMAKIRWYAKFESFQKVGRLEKTLAKNSQNVMPIYGRSEWRGLLRRRVGRRCRSGMIYN